MPVTLGDAVVYFRGDLKPLMQAMGQAQQATKQSAAAQKMSLMDIYAGWNLVKEAVGKVVDVYRQTIGLWSEWGHQAMDMQYQLGGTAEEMSGFAGAAKMVGMDVSEITGGLRILMNNTGKLADDMRAGKGATGEFADALKRMGIDAKAFVSLGFIDQVKALADGLLTLPAGAQRTAAGMATVGRSFYTWTDLLESGGEGLQQLIDQARIAGFTMNQVGAETAEKTDMAAKRISAAWEGIRIKLSSELGPAVADVLEDINKILDRTAAPTFYVPPGLSPEARARIIAQMQATEQAHQATVRWGAAISSTARVQVQASAATLANSNKTRDFGNAAERAAAQVARLNAMVGAGSVARAAYVEKRMAEWEATQGGGGGGISPEESRMQRLRDLEYARADAARQAGYDVSRWRREQYEQLADNEAGLTAELQQEFAQRTEAAYQESLKVKDNDAQLAGDILANEQSYQEKKAEIMKETDENVRKAKLERLERDYSEEQGDMVERARLREEQRKADEERQRQQDLENARVGGAAAGKAMAEKFGEEWDRKMTQQAEHWALLSKGAQVAADESKPPWDTFMTTLHGHEVDAELQWKNIERAAVSAGQNAETAWGWVERTAGGYPTVPTSLGGSYGPPGNREEMAAGGMLWEPVVGRGVKTGKGYLLAESGPEAVAPAGKGPAGAIVVQLLGNVYVNSREETQAFGSDLGHGLRTSLRSQGIAS